MWQERHMTHSMTNMYLCNTYVFWSWCGRSIYISLFQFQALSFCHFLSPVCVLLLSLIILFTAPIPCIVRHLHARSYARTITGHVRKSNSYIFTHFIHSHTTQHPPCPYRTSTHREMNFQKNKTTRLRGGSVNVVCVSTWTATKRHTQRVRHRRPRHSLYVFVSFRALACEV